MSRDIELQGLAEFRVTLRVIDGGVPVYRTFVIVRAVLEAHGEYGPVRALSEKEAYQESLDGPYWYKVDRVERRYSSAKPFEEVRYPVPRRAPAFANLDAADSLEPSFDIWP